MFRTDNPVEGAGGLYPLLRRVVPRWGFELLAGLVVDHCARVLGIAKSVENYAGTPATTARRWNVIPVESLRDAKLRVAHLYEFTKDAANHGDFRRQALG